jgi:hypothetical protein
MDYILKTLNVTIGFYYSIFLNFANSFFLMSIIEVRNFKFKRQIIFLGNGT